MKHFSLFSSGSFVISGHTLKSLIHFDLIFVTGRRLGLVSFSYPILLLKIKSHLFCSRCLHWDYGVLPHDLVWWCTCGLSQAQSFVLINSSQVHVISICAISVHSDHSVEVLFVIVLQCKVTLFFPNLKKFCGGVLSNRTNISFFISLCSFIYFYLCGIIVSCSVCWVIACLSLFFMCKLFLIKPGGAHAGWFLCPFALISLFFGHFLVCLL